MTQLCVYGKLQDMNLQPLSVLLVVTSVYNDTI